MILMVVSILLISGCASTKTQADFNGGLFVTTEGGDYVVLNSSGGIIQDVWKIKNSFVKSAAESDGWIFTDQQGNSIALGGDTKVVRVNDSDTWNKYKEYHIEFSGGMSYFEWLEQ